MRPKFRLLYASKPRGRHHHWANSEFTKFSYPCVMDDFGNSVPVAGPRGGISRYHQRPYYIYWRT
jgi:hypothetical protein